jgi:hypothetical protein
MEKVALKFLEHPELCNIDNINKNGESVLTLSKKNSLDLILIKILELNFNKPRTLTK